MYVKEYVNLYKCMCVYTLKTVCTQWTKYINVCMYTMNMYIEYTGASLTEAETMQQKYCMLHTNISCEMLQIAPLPNNVQRSSPLLMHFLALLPTL